MRALIVNLINRLRQWLITHLSEKTPCTHRWYVIIEHYPTYAWDKWCCADCGYCQDFPNSEPPVKLEQEICSLGHLHIVNRPSSVEWPEVIG